MAGKAEQLVQGRLNPDDAEENSVASSISLSNDADKTNVVATELKKELSTPPGSLSRSLTRKSSSGRLG